jgi:hypothetical protein
MFTGSVLVGLAGQCRRRAGEGHRAIGVVIASGQQVR